MTSHSIRRKAPTKITEALHGLIKKACAYGSDADVAGSFRVSKSTVNRIRHSKSYRVRAADWAQPVGRDGDREDAA